MFKVGDKVHTCVFVAGVRQKMSAGIVTAIHSGWCEVDVMSLHGGAPWIRFESNSHLVLFEQ